MSPQLDSGPIVLPSNVGDRSNVFRYPGSFFTAALKPIFTSSGFGQTSGEGTGEGDEGGTVGDGEGKTGDGTGIGVGLGSGEGEIVGDGEAEGAGEGLGIQEPSITQGGISPQPSISSAARTKAVFTF